MPETNSMAAASTAPDVLALSKRAWKLGAALSKLSQHTEITEESTAGLTDIVKRLGNECDLVYSDLESVLSNGGVGSPLGNYDDATAWHCLETHTRETSQTLHELEAIVRERPQMLSQTNAIIQGIRKRLCRHTSNLRTILLLISM